MRPWRVPTWTFVPDAATAKAVMGSFVGGLAAASQFIPASVLR
ncbi:MAG TPA: hypothetical protein VGL43_01770 [Casimicrobiaceae bacterium]